VLMTSSGTRALIRSGQFFKLASAIETSAAEGSFTFARYGEWLARKAEFVQPTSLPAEPITEAPPPALPAARAGRRPAAPVTARTEEDGTLVLSEADDDLSSILEALEKD
jgi:twitching motility protein PilT